MQCDHIDKKLRDQSAQQFLHHRIHLKHQMTSKRMRTNNLVLKFTASLSKTVNLLCHQLVFPQNNVCFSQIQNFVPDCSQQDVLVSHFFDAVSQDRDVAITPPNEFDNHAPSSRGLSDHPSLRCWPVHALLLVTDDHHIMLDLRWFGHRLSRRSLKFLI